MRIPVWMTHPASQILALGSIIALIVTWVGRQQHQWDRSVVEFQHQITVVPYNASLDTNTNRMGISSSRSSATTNTSSATAATDALPDIARRFFSRVFSFQEGTSASHDNSTTVSYPPKIVSLRVQQTGQLLLDDSPPSLTAATASTDSYQSWLSFQANQLLTYRGLVWQGQISLMHLDWTRTRVDASASPPPPFILSTKTSNLSRKRALLSWRRRILRPWPLWWISQQLDSLLTVWAMDALVLPHPHDDGGTASKTARNMHDGAGARGSFRASMLKGVISLADISTTTAPGSSSDGQCPSSSPSSSTNFDAEDNQQSLLWKALAYRWLAEVAVLMPTALLPQSGLVIWKEAPNPASFSSPIEQSQKKKQAVIELNIPSPFSGCKNITSSSSPSSSSLNNDPASAPIREDASPVSLTVTFDDDGFVSSLQGIRPCLEKDHTFTHRKWIGIFGSYRWIHHGFWVPTHMEAGWIVHKNTHNDTRKDERKEGEETDDEVDFYFRGEYIQLEYDVEE